jgi:hypothetical protein
LRQNCDPGKQKLKGAVRTETYQHHYCQHISTAKREVPESLHLKYRGTVTLLGNKADFRQKHLGF